MRVLARRVAWRVVARIGDYLSCPLSCNVDRKLLLDSSRGVSQSAERAEGFIGIQVEGRLTGSVVCQPGPVGRDRECPEKSRSAGTARLG